MTAKDIDPNRLYRSTENKILFGVCAGIADYFGFSVLVFRLIIIALTFVLPPVIIIGYLVLAILLPKRPKTLFRDDHQDTFWRSVRGSPQEVLHNIKHVFVEIEHRVQKIEKHVTSKHYQFERDLGES